jgi:hypothetical protein
VCVCVCVCINLESPVRSRLAAPRFSITIRGQLCTYSNKSGNAVDTATKARVRPLKGGDLAALAKRIAASSALAGTDAKAVVIEGVICLRYFPILLYVSLSLSLCVCLS